MSLYQTVRLDDKVSAEYVEVWKVEKANPRNRELMRYETQSITAPTGRKVEFYARTRFPSPESGPAEIKRRGL